MQAIIKQTDTSKDGKEKVKMEQKPNLLIIDEIDGASSSGGSDVSSWIAGAYANCYLINLPIELYKAVGTISNGRYIQR